MNFQRNFPVIAWTVATLLQWSFCSKFVHFIVRIAITWLASDMSARSIFGDWQQGTAQFAVWTSEYPRWEFSIADFKRYMGTKC